MAGTNNSVQVREAHYYPFWINRRACDRTKIYKNYLPIRAKFFLPIFANKIIILLVKHILCKTQLKDTTKVFILEDYSINV